MNSQLLIPPRLKVGYVNRNDTYAGKLGYVIYYDTKGVLRKEEGWERWRNKDLGFDEFDNLPTEGFVLNRNVGGIKQSWGWNARVEKIRVYDPRGFEFEISIPNLLYIIENCSFSKGKGLEGEFVYSWHGKELVLLPVGSNEYNASQNFTVLQGQKFSARDLKPGFTYQTKTQKQEIYIGRYLWCENAHIDSDKTDDVYTDKVRSDKKYHIFYQLDSKQFKQVASPTHIANEISEKSVDNLQELLEKFQQFPNTSKPIAIQAELKPIVFKQLNTNDYYIHIGSYFKQISLGVFQENSITAELIYGRKRTFKGYRVSESYIYEFKNGEIYRRYPKRENSWSSSFFDRRPREVFYTEKEIQDMGLLHLYVTLEDGRIIEKNDYKVI